MQNRGCISRLTLSLPVQIGIIFIYLVPSKCSQCTGRKNRLTSILEKKKEKTQNLHATVEALKTNWYY
jgi:hypothetical protein